MGPDTGNDRGEKRTVPVVSGLVDPGQERWPLVGSSQVDTVALGTVAAYKSSPAAAEPTSGVAWASPDEAQADSNPARTDAVSSRANLIVQDATRGGGGTGR
jgi:hypothetical protein